MHLTWRHRELGFKALQGCVTLERLLYLCLL